MTKPMCEQLRAVLATRCVVIGVGNVLRGDDGVGPALVEALPDRPGRMRIVAGTTPENYVGKIIQFHPETVLLVDAVNLGLAPGAWALLPATALGPAGLSTHDLPLWLAIQYIQNGTDAQFLVLAVQPEDTAFGHPLSAAVCEAMGQINNVLVPGE